MCAGLWWPLNRIIGSINVGVWSCGRKLSSLLDSVGMGLAPGVNSGGICERRRVSINKVVPSLVHLGPSFDFTLEQMLGRDGRMVNIWSSVNTP